jgi:hypothetical protein
MQQLYLDCPDHKAIVKMPCFTMKVVKIQRDANKIKKKLGHPYSVESIAATVKHLDTLRNVHFVCSWDTRGAVRRTNLINKMKHSALFPNFNKFYKNELGYHYLFYLTKPILWADEADLTI